ncbi:MAG: SIS domain-containing protein, partial [Xanthomonadales bacterium]|nr:SIS domain-containing protein [Xanthomonadales bacterium]
MYAESGESAQVLERQLERNEAVISELASTLKRTPPRVIVTCARGSSDHAATFAKYALETQLGIVTASSSLSVGSVYETRLDMRDGLFLAISQSGKSPDLLRNAEVARAGGARVVALVNDTSSPLASLADVSIGLQAGPERSVAATKSYLGTLTSVLHLIARWKDDAALLAALQALPDAMRQASVQDWSALVEGLAYARNLFVLGRGFGLGAAQEAALKFKETSGLHA